MAVHGPQHIAAASAVEMETSAKIHEEGGEPRPRSVMKVDEIKVDTLKKARSLELNLTADPTAEPTVLELQLAQEVKARLSVFETLIILSGVLVGAANFLFLESRGSHANAQYNGVASFNLLVSSMCLAANVYGTAIILLQQVSLIPQPEPHQCPPPHYYRSNAVPTLQSVPAHTHPRTYRHLRQHKASFRVSQRRYRAALQGWQAVRAQRDNAVMGITLSLPGLLCAGAFYAIGGRTVTRGNWAAFAVLQYCSLHVTYAILTMESEFTQAEAVDENIHAMLAWTQVCCVSGVRFLASYSTPSRRTQSSVPLYRNATLVHRHQSPGKCLPGGSSRFDCHDSQSLWTWSCAQSRRVTQSRQSPKSPSRNQIWARSYVQSRKSRRNRKRQSAQRRHHRKRPRQISHQSKSVVFKETSRDQRWSTNSCHRVPRVLRETPYPVLTESSGYTCDRLLI